MYGGVHSVGRIAQKEGILDIVQKQQSIFHDQIGQIFTFAFFYFDLSFVVSEWWVIAPWSTLWPSGNIDIKTVFQRIITEVPFPRMAGDIALFF